MKDTLTGLSLSLIVHLSLACAFVALSFSPQAERKKAISLDFTVVDSGLAMRSAAGERAGGTPARTAQGRGGTAGAVAQPPGGLVAGSAEEVLPSAAKAVPSEPEGPVIAGRERGLPADGGDGFGGMRKGSSGPGSGQGGDGAGRGGGGYGLDFGSGGSGALEFAFIRHDILKNIRYPEKARRLRWEGRVVLSFSVLEDGSVKGVAVVRSSGFPVLDENAKVAVARTAFSRPVTRRLDVVLPVEYRLQ